MKKDFSTSPAGQFISAPIPQRSDVPDGYKRNPEFIQKKERRVQLLMQNELYERAKAQATAENLSFNAYIHKILEKALKESD